MSNPNELVFNREYAFEYATAQTIAPGIRRVVAENPGPFTFYGTGTYIVGRETVAIINPGPNQPTHIDAVLEAVESHTVSHLLVTHTHLDHSPACHAVQRVTGAPTVGYGPHGSEQTEAKDVVEEGADYAFSPDITVRHGDVLKSGGNSFECVYTPGHTSNHICYQWRERYALFCGDHVMGWNSTIVSPPDGDMSDYIDSLDLLLQRDDAIYYPTHGSPITAPGPYVSALRHHRLQRAQQILQCLSQGEMSAMQVTEQLYTHLLSSMLGAAAQAVFATLIFLQRQGKVVTDKDHDIRSIWRLC